MTKQSQAYGSWKSSLDSSRITAGAVGIGLPRFDAVTGALYWLEARPEENGRQVVIRLDPNRGSREVTQRDTNVRTRVHEYGGGDYGVRDDCVVFSNGSDHRVYVQRASDSHSTAEVATTPLTEEESKYADFAISPDGSRVVAVEERPRPGCEAENRLVCLSMNGREELEVLASGHDFYSSPCFSDDGSQLSHLAWDHPCMPWDGTTLYLQEWRDGGCSEAPTVVAGGPEESIFQPRFSPGGCLTFVSDRSGWWNLYQLRDGGKIVPLYPSESEFGVAQWVFGMSTYDFESESELICVERSQGLDRLLHIDIASGRGTPIDVDCDSISGLQVSKRRIAFVGASWTRGSALILLDLESGRSSHIRESSPDPLDSEWVSVPEAIKFPTGDAELGETAHAFLYRPKNPHFQGLPGSQPPLIVMAHGGPTAAASPELSMKTQYWTTRGFSVVDVNYRGSRGFGRPYRDRLRGGWGKLDVEDCVAAANEIVRIGEADPRCLAIRGGSAGGYTTLCALTFFDTFTAGASHYGIGDLETLAQDTHKFESRYLDNLVGPYPSRKDLYVERSPIHFTDRLNCPVIFFQGLNDKVVPPNQAEAMVEALAQRRIPHAYVPFEGEEHGFRMAQNIRAALDGELYFYARVFGFEVDVRPEQVEIIGME